MVGGVEGVVADVAAAVAAVEDSPLRLSRMRAVGPLGVFSSRPMGVRYGGFDVKGGGVSALVEEDGVRVVQTWTCRAIGGREHAEREGEAEWEDRVLCALVRMMLRWT